jgi:hypothetical protein
LRHVVLAATLSAKEKISQVRQELLDPLMEAADESLALAKAVPDDKYAWRPMEGVRSFGEVFVHMAGSTLLFCSYAGLKPPSGPAHDLAAVYMNEMKRGFEMPEIFCGGEGHQDQGATHRDHGTGFPHGARYDPPDAR